MKVDELQVTEQQVDELQVDKLQVDEQQVGELSCHIFFTAKKPHPTVFSNSQHDFPSSHPKRHSALLNFGETGAKYWQYLGKTFWQNVLAKRFSKTFRQNVLAKLLQTIGEHLPNTWQKIEIKFTKIGKKWRRFSKYLAKNWQKLTNIWQKLTNIWQKLTNIWQKLTNIWQKLGINFAKNFAFYCQLLWQNISFTLSA
jgi:hypothetical protein